MPIPPLYRLLGSLLALSPLIAAAENVPNLKLVLPKAPGLEVRLTTSAYHFVVDDSATPAPTAKLVVGKLPPIAPSFSAMAVLDNRTASNIAFTFPNPDAAEKHFTFRVFDSTGKKIWESDAGVVTPQVEKSATLVHHTNWNRLIHVPLKVDGKALVEGVYTLEASIDADKAVGATTVFEVARPPKPPGKDTGIDGLVLLGPIVPVETPGQPNEKPLAGAFVHVEEIRQPGVFYIRAPFSWDGVTNKDGKFLVYTPSGKFKVTARKLNLRIPLPLNVGTNLESELFIPPIFNPVATIEVTVEQGHLTPATLHLDSGIR